MDRNLEMRKPGNNVRPEIAQENRGGKNNKRLIERLNDWIDTVMPDRF